MISFVVPAHDEAAWIGRSVAAVHVGRREALDYWYGPRPGHTANAERPTPTH